MDRRLSQFLAVAETGNLSRAAELLHVSQPTISVTLRRLEEEHGVRLFERSSRGVVLTEFGQVLYDHVRAMKRLDDHARAEILARRSNKKHGLRIGCGYAWWLFPLHGAVEDFRSDNPDRSVLVDVSSSLDGLRKVLSGDIMLFLGTKLEALKPELAVRFEPLFSARHGYFARAEHPLTGRPCSLAEIARFELMDVVPVETGHLAILDPRHMNSTKDTPSVPPSTLSTNSMTVCIDLMTGSDAVLGYPIVLEEHFARRGIYPLNVEAADVWETIGVYNLEEKAQSADLKDFLTRVENRLDDQPGSNSVIRLFGHQLSAETNDTPI